VASPMATMLDCQRDFYRRIQSYALDDPSHEMGFVWHLMRLTSWSRECCLRAMEEYKKFAFLAAVAGHSVVPSDQVDQVWHLHLLDSKAYWEDFCPNVLGLKLHHRPARGGSQERESMHRLYRVTIDRYRQFFGEPPLDLWPPADLRFGSDLRRQRAPIMRHLTARMRFSSTAWLRSGRRHLLPVLSLLALWATASIPMARASRATGPATSASADLQVMLLLALATVVGLALRHLMRRPGTQSAVPRLSAEQLAYLARGGKGALDVALAQLVDRGALQPNRDRKTLNLTFFVSPCVSPLEQQLVYRLTQLAPMPTYERLIIPSTYDYSTLKDNLREKCLIVGPLSLAASRSFYLFLIPLIVYLSVSVTLPFSREFRHALGSVFLGPWTLALVCSVFLIIPGGRTRWGASVLRHHQKHGDAHDPMMRVALLGPTALTGGQLDELRLLIQQSGQGASGSGGGACSGGCGSGCGGGCGGGC
jgi:uncharacterized protein (TIGR04222 family)